LQDPDFEAHLSLRARTAVAVPGMRDAIHFVFFVASLAAIAAQVRRNS